MAAMIGAAALSPAATYIDTRPYRDGAAAGRLVLQRCRDTGRFQHPPRPVSLYTGSRNLDWCEVSGRGVLRARTVVRVPAPGFEARVPYAVGVVELAEGVSVLAGLVGGDLGSWRIGMALRVEWEQGADGLPVPVFSPAS